MRRILLIIASLVCTHSAAAQSHADFVAPTTLENTEGSVFFGLSNSFTYQQIYGTSQLVGLSVGEQISGMQFRLNGFQPGGPPVAMSALSFDVYIGPSNFPVGSLTDNVAANQGAGTTLVRSGSLSIPAFSFPGAANPNDFGLLIPFSTAHTYNGGSLLVTITNTDFSPGSLAFDAGFNISNTQARQADGYNNPTVDENFPNAALVIRFTTGVIPEPGNAMLLVMCLVAGLFSRQRRERPYSFP